MKSLFVNGHIRLLPTLGLLLVCGLLIFSVFFFASPVSAYFFPTPVPTQEYMWSYVEIAKPLKTDSIASLPAGTPLAESSSLLIDATSSPVIVETATPQPPIATETPAQLAMEVLENTPTPIYVPPTEIPQQQVAAAPVYSYNSSKYVLVDISEQHMYVYEGEQLVYSFVASTGMNNATRVGTFAVQSKIPSAYGSTWDIWMPNWLGIYWSGGLENGIHALPIMSNGATLWEGYLGRPISYGCVVLGSYESGLLYDWAEIGTTVEIQW